MSQKAIKNRLLTRARPDIRPLSLAVGLLCLVLLVGMSTTATAQSTHGSIVGTLTDATNAVLPGVSVTVTNKDTNISRTVLSNDTGYYEATALIAGTYRVQAELPGFKTMMRDGIILESRAIVRIDLRMEVGEQTTSIEVRAVSPVIQSETASLSDIKTADHLEQLPTLSTVNNWNVVVTMPGVQTVQTRTIFSFNGGRGAQSEIMFDGINTPRLGTALAGIPNSTEATDEMQVHASNNSAEFGSAGVVNLISRSGGNKLHGTLYYYHADDKLNSKNPFQTTKPRLKQHDYGVNVGGPLVLPKLYNGTDRTFFMVNYYGNQIPGDTSYTLNVPTLAMRQGDFSKSGLTVKDPLTGQPFAGNIIPAARFSPVAVKIQERFFDKPTAANPDTLAGNLRGSISAPVHENRIDVRIDHKIYDKNFLYVRYNWRGQVQAALPSLPSIGLTDGYRGGQGLVASDTHLFTPNLINEFRFGFQKSPNRQLATQSGNEIVQDAGIQGIEAADYNGMPTFDVTGFTTIQAQKHLNDMNQIHQATDTLSWVKGSHSFKTGVDFQYNQAYGPSIPAELFGSFNFNGYFTGSSYADFLLGYPLYARRAGYRGDKNKHGTDMALYFQDSWRLAQKVTFEWGVRYERQFASVDDEELMYNFDPKTGNLVVPDKALTSGKINPLLPSNITVVSASTAGFPQALRNPQTGNIVPRLGIAYRPFSNTVIRGGYGIFIDGFGTYVTAPQQTPLFGYVEEFRNTNKNNPTYKFPNPFVGTGASYGALDIGTVSYPGFDINIRNPRFHQWNLTLERQIGEIGARLSYIGSASRDLLYRQSLNVPQPSTIPYTTSRKPWQQYANVYYASNDGLGVGTAGSDYHSMQLDVEKRFGSGLFFQGAWTWAKLMADVEDARSEFGPHIENPFDVRRERAEEQYSPRHRLVGSAIWELPVGKSRWLGGSMPGLLDKIVGQWSLSAIFLLQTGQFYTPYFTGRDISGTNLSRPQHDEGALPGLRPDRVADGNVPADQRTQQRWYDASAFVIPAANIGRFGNCGRNVIEGPGLNVQHAALGKRFILTEGTTLSFQMNVNNVFNHTNLSMPNSALNLSQPLNVGKIVGTRGGLENGGPRNMNFEMRLRF
ncbi:MAG: TonB-dependent receptor [Acidobacteria bacterium]|nr:MAG: TonB-dependent receptor [Acidobacteriota bacterium]